MMADDKTEIDGAVPLEGPKPPLSIQVGVENGRVIGIKITDPGSNYLEEPEVSISAPKEAFCIPQYR